MPDFSYIHKVFDGASSGAGVTDEDARAVLQQFQQDTQKQQAQQQQQAQVPGRVVQSGSTVNRGGRDLLGAASKWVTENVGIPLEDAVDNIFQGNQRTPDQIARDRAAGEEKAQQWLNNQAGLDELPKPLQAPANALVGASRVVAGGATGAAEKALQTVELLGDTAKTFASLGRVKEDQNPFSSRYEWAIWDLGKAEVGAKSGVGQVAQGFLEFGLLMAATGGFNNLPGAAQKFAAAGSALEKVGVVAQAGAYGAAAGVAADMISATSGQGNLSNLIKDNAPELYPTWLTALAVDEDDNPYEAMLKTALEGMGIGFAADALGAYLAGVRAAKRVFKGASSGPLNSTKPITPEEYVQALEATKASDPAQYWSVDAVDLDSASKGKIISVEGGAGLVGPDGDIKGVFKDPSSGRKGVADEILQEAVRQGGIKLDNFDGYLTRIYERNGFRQVGRVPFNADYAPPGWDEALHGRPDVVAMIYDPKGLVDMSDEARRFTDYDEMIAYRDSFLDAYPQLRLNGVAPEKASEELLEQAGKASVEAAQKADAEALARRVADAPQIPNVLERQPAVDPDDLLRRMRESSVTGDTDAFDEWRRLPREVREEKYKAVESFYNHVTHAQERVSAMELMDPEQGAALRAAFDETYRDYGAGEASVDMNRMRETRPVVEQLADNGNAVVTVNLNGHEGRWHLFEIEEEGFKTIEVSWSAQADTGNSVVRMRSSWRDIARELEPGTVVRNSPIADRASAISGARSRALAARSEETFARYAEQAAEIFNQRYTGNFEESKQLFNTPNAQTPWEVMSRENQEAFIRQYQRSGLIEGGISGHQVISGQDSIRARLYEHEGFGPLDSIGEQWGVIRGTPGPHGRMVEPLDPDLPTDVLKERIAQFKMQGDLDKASNLGELAYYDRQVLGYLRRQFDALGGADDPDAVEAALRQEYSRIEDRMAGDRYLARQIEQGIPVTWDDIASSEPNYFLPGSRDISAGPHPGLETFIRDNPDGFTVNPFTLEPPQGGFAVAIDGLKLHGTDPEELATFIARNQDIFSRDDAFIGGWKNGDDFDLEVSRIVGDRNEAVYLAKKFDQKAVFDLNKFEEIPTGGKDLLASTKDGHILSRLGIPGEAQPVSSTRAIGQQIAARSNPNVRGGAQRMVTDAQLRQIARAAGDQPANVLRSLVRNNPIDLEDLSRISRMSVDEVVADAAKGIQDALGAAGEVDFNKLLKMNVDGEELLSRAGIVQVRGLMQEVSTRLYDSAYNVMKLGEVNMDVFPQVERMVDDLKALMRVHKVSANAYSHLLSAHKLKIPLLGVEVPNIFKPPSVEAIAKEIKDADKVLDDIVKALRVGEPAAKQEAWRLATALMMSEGDPSQMQPLWRRLATVTTGNTLSVMYNSMLSGPKTHLVNTLSNAINTIYRPISAFAGSGADAAVRRSALAGFYNFHETLGAATSLAWKTLKDGAPVDEGGKAFVMAAEIDQQMKLLHRAAEMSTDKGFKAAVGYMDMMAGLAKNPWLSWPSRLLATEDEFFKAMMGRMEFNSRTMMEAVSTAESTGRPVQEVFNNLLKINRDEAFDSATGALKDHSLIAAAKDVTFQTDLEGQIQHFANFVNNVPLVRPFFPFVKVGHNITVYAATHVPVLAPALKEFKMAMEAGDAYTRAIYRGRVAAGWMIVTGAALATHSGMITGNGPADADEKKLWMKTHAPRSIKLNDKTWVDYSRIEPFGQIVSAVADLYYMFNSGKLSEDRASYMAGYLAYAMASNFTNKSYMQGVVPLARLLAPGLSGRDGILKGLLDAGNNLLPLAGLRRAFANAMTPYSQEFNTLYDSTVYTASAGLVKNGAVSYDWLTGEKVPSGSGGANAIFPLAVNVRGSDVVKDALEDIEFDSTVVGKTISGVRLDAKHRSRVQQLMGQGGLYRELKAIVTDPSFRPAVADFQERLRRGERVHKENEIFHRRIMRTIERYRDLAILQVKNEYPELRKEITSNRLIRASQLRPEQAQAPIDFEHLVNMPN